MGDDPPDAPRSRREFLDVAALSVAAAGAVGVCAWAVLHGGRSRPGAARSGEALEVALGGLAPGAQRVVAWRGLPVLVLHRSEAEIAALRAPALRARLLDPDSHTRQQPDYACNWHRSIDPAWGVLVGICTHQGCTPALGGGLYRCPCHGSGFDLAGRVFSGAPARLNLPVPPYAMGGDRILRLGANDADPGYDLDKVEKL